MLPFAGTGTLNLLAFFPLNQAYKKIVKERKLKEQKKLLYRLIKKLQSMKDTVIGGDLPTYSVVVIVDLKCINQHFYVLTALMHCSLESQSGHFLLLKDLESRQNLAEMEGRDVKSCRGESVQSV